MKIKNKILICITIMLLFAVFFCNNYSYAAQRLELRTTNQINQLISEINSKLSSYGHNTANYDMQNYTSKTFEENWIANNTRYTSKTTISVNNGVYSRIYNTKFSNKYRIKQSDQQTNGRWRFTKSDR